MVRYRLRLVHVHPDITVSGFDVQGCLELSDEVTIGRSKYSEIVVGIRHRPGLEEPGCLLLGGRRSYWIRVHDDGTPWLHHGGHIGRARIRRWRLEIPVDGIGDRWSHALQPGDIVEIDTVTGELALSLAIGEPAPTGR